MQSFSIFNRVYRAFSTLFVIVVGLVAGQAYASPEMIGELSETRAMQVIIIKGEKIPTLLNQASDDYSIMAVSGDKLTAIPFQFDDWNERGFPYVPGGTLKIDGVEGIIEPQDELVFMLRDLGPQADDVLKNLEEGSLLAELAFVEDGVERYAYIVKGNSQRSDKKYTYYNIETGLLKTTKYSLQTDPDNLLVWSDMLYEGYEGGTKTILDTMKLRVKARLGFIKATISNNLIPSEVVAVKNGPVRSLIALDASISIFGVALADAGASVTMTDQTLQFPVYLTIPKAASILSNLLLEVSLDFNDMPDAKVRTELGPKEPILAGNEDKGGNPEDYNIDLEHSWLSLSTEKDWDIIAFFSGKTGFKPTLNALYKDSRYNEKADSPERFEGSAPHVGYLVEDIVYGESIVIGIDLFFDDAFWSKDGLENSVHMLRNPMPLSVNII
ncbi:MAG: hypothetical protein COB51_03295 [Moraxellaceae bacterium]|nr:MAG: hypothetical protein COB51_03295 [Moraxellaceae bacterium]